MLSSLQHVSIVKKDRCILFVKTLEPQLTTLSTISVKKANGASEWIAPPEMDGPGTGVGIGVGVGAA